MSALHDILGKLSYRVLPEWEKKLWAAQKDMIPEYCFMPDKHLGLPLNDKEEKRLRKYCLLPNGKPLPHGPCEDDYRICAFSNYHSRKVRKYVITFYMKKIVGLLSQENFEEAAKFGGAFAHYLQDACCPAHVINNFLLNSLFPPSSKHAWHYHRIIDAWPCDEKSITPSPRLMGSSVDEAVFNLCMEYDMATAFALSQVCPLVSAIQENNHQKANAISNAFNSKAVEFGSSAWHTAFSLAFGRFSKRELAGLGTIHLADCIPINELSEKFSREKLVKYGIKFYDTAYREADPSRSKLSNDSYPFEAIANSASDGKGKAFPLSLNIIKNGKQVQKNFKKGFAAGGYSIIAFEAPGSIFGEFKVLAGIHPSSPRDSKASFAVFCEQSGKKVFGNKKVSETDSAIELKIPLDCKCKTVFMIVTEGTRGLHAIWANPILTKRA